MQPSPPPGSRPARFAESGRSIGRAVGFAPEFSSERAGWSSLALYGWRGQCREAQFEPLDEPVVVYHVGGAQDVSVCVGRRWQRRTHPGLITVIPPATPIRWEIRGEVYSRSVHLGSRFFCGVNDDGDVAGAAREALRIRCGVQDPLLASAIQALESELRQPAQHGSLYADSVSDLMALHLLRETGRAAGVAPRAGGLSRGMLRRVLDRLEASIETGISLHRLAEEAALSRAHFASAFRQSTGLSPHRYLTQRRLQRAGILLRQTRLPLADVALRCGFATQAHFTESFRREHGITPGRFRCEAER